MPASLAAISMRRGISNAGVLPIAVLLAWSAACERDRDALYSGAAGAEAPLAPIVPDEDRVSACEDCAAEQCGQAREACLEDDACTGLLHCTGSCSDPACVVACEVAHGWSPWFEDMRACMAPSCGAACGLGENWDCLGDYDWPGATEIPFGVDLWFADVTGAAIAARTEPFLPGARVRVCFDPTCDEVGDEGVVGGDNRVTLDLRPSSFGTDFRDYFEVDDGTGRVLLTYWLPLARAGFARLAHHWVLTRIEGWHPEEPGAVSLDPRQSRIVVLPLDCSLAGALGMRVELAEAPEAPVLYGLVLTASMAPPGRRASRPPIASAPESHSHPARADGSRGHTPRNAARP